MANRVLQIEQILGDPDRLAVQIANQFVHWEMARQGWLAEKREIREYIFSTDTSTTSTSSLPWKNSTHIPKLCQIRDNLHANYMAALFPNDRPLKWEGDDESSDTKSKRTAIESYMENKLRMGNFRTVISQVVLDFIDYGNCFSMSEFVAEENIDGTTEEKIPGFVGPRAKRISPLDIVFDITSPTFPEAPKIIRSIKSLGSLKADIDDHPEMAYMADVFEKMKTCRHNFAGMNSGDVEKNAAFEIDGFASFPDYMSSDYVEILDFYGDIYDKTKDEFRKQRLISVVDRAWIIRDIPNPSWIGASDIHHAGWRLRPDNLMGMGPLDNLVGMQYRIDHLENAKADAFDLVIQPVMKIKGLVEDFDYGPGARIYMGDDGDVAFMAPDTTALNADTQIQMLEQKMEEMAGAPKQAMGFRTPGEKTAYEVQILENGANRVFINKTSYFEEIFLEPLLNSMLEQARRNMGPADVIRVMDDQYGVVNFMSVTREDIAAKGKLRPIGARHFARNANILQNLTQFSNSPLGQDQAVNAHISGKKIAHLVEELLDLERYELVQDNIRIAEQLETQKLAEQAKQTLLEQMQPNGATNPMAGPPQGAPGAGAIPAGNPPK